MKVRYTVPSAVTRAAYVGNDVTTVFSAPFNFFDDTDLDVILVNDTTAVETVQVLTTNYTVTGGDGSTGSVTMLVAPPTGTTLVIERNVPFTQEIDLEPNDPFPAEVTEEGFDRSVMLAQQNKLEIQKSPKLPPTYDPDSDPEIRIPVPVAGKVLIGNADSDGWDNGDIEDISTADIPAVISSIADRELLEYDSGSVVWRNQSLATILKRMLTTAGDIAVNIAGTVSRLAVGSAGQVLGVSGGTPTWVANSVLPQGRLTLETGVPVSSTDQAGKATVYYTPYQGNVVPIYNGTEFIPTASTELSNDTTASATNNAGAAAAGPYQIQDCFIWSNAGTNRLTRSPKWSASATATMTIATPCVVTWTAHGLWDGATARFTTTGALPTGLTASTDYFITKIDANTFNLSTTLANQVAGTKIATSGTQSGVHTAFNYTSVRGTGAATTELQMLNGIYVNKYDITNGPAATKGTYVGSVYFNASSQIDLKFGSLASGGGEAILGVWNTYNRVNLRGRVGDSDNSWTHSGSWKPAHASATQRVSWVQGLQEDAFEAECDAWYSDNTGNAHAAAGIGHNSTQSPSGRFGRSYSPGAAGVAVRGSAGAQGFGFNYMAELHAIISASGTISFYGDNGSTTVQTGIGWRGRV
jgi:hypothetical protein